MIIIILFTLAQCFAETGDKKPLSASPPKKVFKTTETHQFSGSKLRGQLKKPELSYIYQRKGLRAERIVNIPEDFNEEIISGAGQL